MDTLKWHHNPDGTATVEHWKDGVKKAHFTGPLTISGADMEKRLMGAFWVVNAGEINARPEKTLIPPSWWIKD